MTTTTWTQQAGMDATDDTVGPVTYPQPPDNSSTAWTQQAGMETAADVGSVASIADAVAENAASALESAENAEAAYQATIAHTFTTTAITDIDNTNRSDGSVLVYSGTTLKYVATNVIRGGSY